MREESSRRADSSRDDAGVNRRRTGLNRRRFLAGASATGLAGIAGCFGLLETQRANREPPLVENRPDAPYVPTHYEGMKSAGMVANGRYRAMLSYTFPHRFWLVNGDTTEQVNFENDEDVHLMVSVMDAESGVALPATSPEIELTGPDGDTDSFSPWQMLSQRMGVHYGDNVGLWADGTYEATVQLAPGATRRTSGVEAPDGPLTFSFEFEFSPGLLNDLPFTDIAADREGTEGAVDPMGMKPVQKNQVPSADSFPLEVAGSNSAGGAELLVATTDERGQFATGSDETYVAASLRSKHSRFPLAASTLDLEVVRGGEVQTEATLIPTLDPELGYHYAAAVSDIQSDDELRVTVSTPSQLARHEGYETAFFADLSVTV